MHTHARNTELPKLENTIKCRQKIQQLSTTLVKMNSTKRMKNRSSEREKWLELHHDLFLKNFVDLENQLDLQQVSKPRSPALDNTPPLPTWFEVMRKDKMIRGVSRSGKEYVRTRRFPNELCKVSIDLMVDHNVTASQVPGVLHTTWPAIVPSLDKTHNLGTREVHNNYKRMIPWLCRLQIGWELTQQYWRCEDDGSIGMTLMGDGWDGDATCTCRGHMFTTRQSDTHMSSCVVSR